MGHPGGRTPSGRLGREGTALHGGAPGHEPPEAGPEAGGEAGPEAGGEAGGEAGPPAWIDRKVRIYYVHPRTVGVRAQLCLRAPDGSELGWKDIASGRVMVRHETGRPSLPRALLEAAGPAQRPLPADGLPGVALDIPAGRLLAQLRLRSAAVLVGKEWWDTGGGHRLYATVAWPGKRTTTLGYVDLRTGAPHPGGEGASDLDPELTDQLLQALTVRRPRQLFP